MKNNFVKIVSLGLLTISTYAFSFEIEEDKYLHFGASAAVYVSTELVLDNWKYSLPICLSVGLAKETYDQVSYGGFSKEDMYFNAAGCLSGMMLYELTGEIIKIVPTKGQVYIGTELTF